MTKIQQREWEMRKSGNYKSDPITFNKNKENKYNKYTL